MRSELTDDVAPSNAARQTLRVLLWQTDFPSWLPFMYSGVTRTLIEGFEAAEGVEVRFGAGTRRNASRAFHRNITQWLRERDLFVWIGVNHGEAPWEQLARRGIRRVVYQTEPTHSCEGAHRNRMDELWDFSWHNLEGCSSMRSAPAVLRYVPLGAVRAMPALAAKSSSKLMFFGAPYHGQGRRHCFNDLKRRLRETLKYTYRVWDEDAFQGRVLSNYNLFLNLHKDCGDAHNPVTFRVAKLLNAEKLVISERCHPRDEAEYEGMVLFLDNASHIIESHRQISQSGEWLALARRASTRFRWHFQPSAIFRRAGIYQRFALKQRV